MFRADRGTTKKRLLQTQRGEPPFCAAFFRQSWVKQIVGSRAVHVSLWHQPADARCTVWPALRLQSLQFVRHIVIVVDWRRCGAGIGSGWPCGRTAASVLHRWLRRLLLLHGTDYVVVAAACGCASFLWLHTALLQQDSSDSSPALAVVFVECTPRSAGNPSFVRVRPRSLTKALGCSVLCLVVKRSLHG